MKWLLSGSVGSGSSVSNCWLTCQANKTVLDAAGSCAVQLKYIFQENYKSTNSKTIFIHNSTLLLLLLLIIIYWFIYFCHVLCFLFYFEASSCLPLVAAHHDHLCLVLTWIVLSWVLRWCCLVPVSSSVAPALSSSHSLAVWFHLLDSNSTVPASPLAPPPWLQRHPAAELVQLVQRSGSSQEIRWGTHLSGSSV